MTKMRYAFVFLVCLSLAAGGFAIMFSIGYYHREQAAQQRQAAQQAADQRAQSAAFERRLCITLGPLVAVATLKPPAGNPATNPSRAFEQKLVAAIAPLAQLAPDLGCKP